MLAAAQRITHLGSWELDLSDLVDLSENPLRWSDEVFRIFGYEPGAIEVTHEAFLQAVHPEDRPASPRPSPEPSRPASHTPSTIASLSPTAPCVWSTSSRRSSITRRPVARMKMLGTVQDITERKQAEEALRLSEQRYRTLMEHAPEAIMIVDPDADSVVDANPSAERLTGSRAKSC